MLEVNDRVYIDKGYYCGETGRIIDRDEKNNMWLVELYDGFSDWIYDDDIAGRLHY